MKIPGDKIKEPRLRAFTVVELITVLAIVGILMGLLLPALQAAKDKAEQLVSMQHQKETGRSLDLYAADHDNRYPESVAKVGFGEQWNWTDPTKLVGSDLRTPGLHRSVSAYLRDYISDPREMYCPSSPRTYAYLDEAWAQGDTWDNPDTPVLMDAVGGTYSFYWNYVGYLSEDLPVFRGPRGPSDGPRYSKLLISDTLGYDHWRRRYAFMSCGHFKGADIVPETLLLSSFWAIDINTPESPPPVSMQAAFVDGHVERFNGSDTFPMRVIKDRATSTPYDGTEPGPGCFYLPQTARHK